MELVASDKHFPGARTLVRFSVAILQVRTARVQWRSGMNSALRFDCGRTESGNRRGDKRTVSGRVSGKLFVFLWPVMGYEWTNDQMHETIL